MTISHYFSIPVFNIMKNILISIIIITLTSTFTAYGQERYRIDLTGFSSQRFDEFSPVIYNEKIVYTSNQEGKLLITYADDANRNLFSIFVTEPADSNIYSPPKLFSRDLVSKYNDGPVSFHQDGELLVYSRNLEKDRKVRKSGDRKQNLGLFFAVLNKGKWIPTTEFKFNNPGYSVTTPCFSPDGKYLYFASDMPGGYGGTDIYRSKADSAAWGDPENLGAAINTAGNEICPFITAEGRLFFSSDGHSGLGSKDIFYAASTGPGWSDPVHLEAPINSVADDFGLITDQEITHGYFSSDRNGTDDIFRFSTRVPLLLNCDTMRMNSYCFEFWDENAPDIDSIPVLYIWEFSDSSRVEGKSVIHCLPGAGSYWARLQIIDEATGEIFHSQSSIEFDIVDHIQPYITSSDTITIHMDTPFSGMESNMPGFVIEQYIWDFGDGSFETGEQVTHSFSAPGIYDVKLGLRGYPEGMEGKELRCVVKPVLVEAALPSEE